MSQSNMSQSKKPNIINANRRKLIAFGSVGAVAVAAVVAIIVVNLDPVEKARQTLTSQQGDLPDTEPTVGNQWQWPRISDQQIQDAVEMSNKTKPEQNAASESETPPAPDENTPLNVVTIYKALENVKLQENGEVVIDDEALKALNRTVNLNELQLNEAGLQELKGVIEAGLPGPAGEKTAEVVTDFYRYQVAKQDLDTSFEAVQTPEQLSNYYDSLVALREQTLGYEVADKLFEKEDAQTRFTLESMMLAKNQELSEEEREARQESLREEYLDTDPDIPNWETRLAAFKSAKEQIIGAGLSEAEKKEQIDSLYRQHFSSGERAEIAHLNLTEF